MIFLRCEAGLYKLYCFRLSHTCPPAKNVCSRDLELNKDTPLFATSDGPLLLIKAGAIDSLNSCMMNVRWRFFHFWNQIPQEKQQELILWGRRFAKCKRTSHCDFGVTSRFVTRVYLTPDHFSVTFLTRVSH